MVAIREVRVDGKSAPSLGIAVKNPVTVCATTTSEPSSAVSVPVVLSQHHLKRIAAGGKQFGILSFAVFQKTVRQIFAQMRQVKHDFGIVVQNFYSQPSFRRSCF